MFRVGLLLLLCAGSVLAFDDVSVSEAFLRVFPYTDDSRPLASEPVAVIARQAARRLALLGVPQNSSALCGLPEEKVLEVLMKAVLGNLFVEKDELPAGALKTPFQTNPVTGLLEYADNYTSNRMTIFQVLICGLVIGLGRAWFLLDGGAPKAKEVPPVETTATEAGMGMRLSAFPRFR